MNVPKPSEKLHHFYTGLEETLTYWRRSVAPKVKEAHNISGGFVRLRDIGEAGDATSQLFTRISKNVPVAGDRVLVAYLEDGEPVIIGKLLASGESEPAFTLIVEEDEGAVVTGATNLDFQTGLIATAVGTEANINLDTVYTDDRYIRRAQPSQIQVGGAWQSGRFVSMMTYGAVGTLSGITLTANRVYYVPIYVPESGTIDAVAFNVTTAVSGNVRVGIYDCDTSFLPANRVNQSTTTAVSTTGAKVIALAGAANVTGGRWYFAALVSTTAMAISGSTVAGQFPALRGGSDGTYGQDYRIMAQQDLAAGWGTMPDPASSGSGSANTFLYLAGRKS